MTIIGTSYTVRRAAADARIEDICACRVHPLMSRNFWTDPQRVRDALGEIRSIEDRQSWD